MDEFKQEVNGSFKLHSINNPQVKKVFIMTRLDKVFEV